MKTVLLAPGHVGHLRPRQTGHFVMCAAAMGSGCCAPAAGSAGHRRKGEVAWRAQPGTGVGLSGARCPPPARPAGHSPAASPGAEPQPHATAESAWKRGPRQLRGLWRNFQGPGTSHQPLHRAPGLRSGFGEGGRKKEREGSPSQSSPFPLSLSSLFPSLLFVCPSLLSHFPPTHRSGFSFSFSSLLK